MPSAKALEAFSQVVIDAQLRAAGWHLLNGRSVRYEYVLPDAPKANYVLGDRPGRSLAVHGNLMQIARDTRMRGGPFSRAC
jgi:hypothetical protein